MWELYPRAREVILVRDFRDMVSSMFAFNAKRGFQGFRRGSVRERRGVRHATSVKGSARGAGGGLAKRARTGPTWCATRT